MKELNLLPRKKITEQYVWQMVLIIWAAAAACSFIIWAASEQMHQAAVQKQHQLSIMQQEMNGLHVQLETSSKTDYAQLMRMIGELNQSRKDWSLFFSAVADALPEQAKIKSMRSNDVSLENPQAVIHVVFADIEQIQIYTARLMQHHLVKEVTVDEIMRKQEDHVKASDAEQAAEHANPAITWDVFMTITLEW